MRGERLAIVAFVALGACETDPTQLVVVVQTDMRVPAELAGFATRVGPAGGQPTDERTFWLDDREGAVTLPASFGVAPEDGDADRRVRIEIAALRADETQMFETHAVTGFVEGLKLRLNMFLAGQCETLAADCPAGFTCTARGCVDETVDPADLQPFDGVDAGGVDAGGVVGEDAATDGGLPSGEDWVIMFGEGSRVAVVASTADAAGNAFLVVKLLTGRLLIDGDELEGIGIALVGISPDGSFLWHPVFLESEDPAAVSPMTLSADGTGNLWMSGLIADAGDIGRGPEANVGRSMFLAQYTGDAGSLLQASVFPAPDANIWGVTITSDGLAVAGDFQGSLTFPNEETLTSVDRHGYVSEVTAAGQYSCVGEILGTSCRADSILYDAQNDALLVAGTFQGALDMDPATFTAGSDQDGFVLALAGCAPFPSLAVQLPHELTRMRAVALDAETALAAGTMNALSGIEDVYLAVIDRGGLSQEVFLGGGESQDILVGLAAVSSEQTAAVAAGTFDAASTLGGSQLEVSGGPDSFLAGVAVDGSVTWVETLSGPGGENVQTLASVPGTNVVYAAGSFDDSVTIGETELLAAEPLGLFLYRKISPP